MAAGVGAAGMLTGLLAVSAVLSGDAAAAVVDVIEVDRDWAVVGIGLVSTLISAPWLVQFIQRRENRKLTLANANRADSEAGASRADGDLREKQAIDVLFAALERRISSLERQNEKQQTTIQRLEQQLLADERVRQEHAAWDYIALDQAHTHDYDLPPVPPLRGVVVA